MQPAHSIKDPENFHGINNANSLDSFSIIRSQEHCKNDTFLAIHSNFPLNPIHIIELHLILEDSPIDVPPTKQKSITIFSHNSIDEARYL
jgi:hypothetical protein